MQIRKIQDDGNKFIIHGGTNVARDLQDTFDNMAMGVSVTADGSGKAHILYTENNRDIVLNVLRDIVN